MHQSPPSRLILDIGIAPHPRPPARNRPPQEPHLPALPAFLVQPRQQSNDIPVSLLAAKPTEPPLIRRTPRHISTPLHLFTSSKPHPSNDRTLSEPEPALHLAYATHPLRPPNTFPHLLPYASIPTRLSGRDSGPRFELTRTQYISRLHIQSVLRKIHNWNSILLESSAGNDRAGRVSLDGTAAQRVRGHGESRFLDRSGWGLGKVEAGTDP